MADPTLPRANPAVVTPDKPAKQTVVEHAKRVAQELGVPYKGVLDIDGLAYFVLIDNAHGSTCAICYGDSFSAAAVAEHLAKAKARLS